MSQIVKRVVQKLRSAITTYKYVDSPGGKIVFDDSLVRLSIQKSKNARLLIDGKLRIRSHLFGNTPSVIVLGANSTVHIQGDFVIGHGVRISVAPDAKLLIGGRENETESGITSDSTIMVKKKIEIGKDFVCSWNVFITDSDWHSFESNPIQKDVTIGNHVWIANNVNILKGSQIGNGSVVASQSKVTNKIFAENTLIAGSSRAIREGINWGRDIG